MALVSDIKYLLKNEHYVKFFEKKKILKQKYNVNCIDGRIPGSLYDRDNHRKYLKELSDLMFEADGDYQKFLWDVLSETDKENMERRARGIKQGGRREQEFNYY